jgi:hypothetical protein
MILAWEPGYTELSINDFDYALGIYSYRYFTPSYYGRLAFSGTQDESSISLLKLRKNVPGDNFSYINNGRLIVLYDFEKKIWDGENRQLMNQIDNELINKKLQEFDQVPRTRYFWPLSFSIESDAAREVLGNHGLTTN